MIRADKHKADKDKTVFLTGREMKLQIKLNLFRVMLAALLCFAGGPRAEAGEVSTELGYEASCECIASKCGACEVETGTTFYTAKCGPEKLKIKSCKKPTCEAVEDQKQCLAALQPDAGKAGKREPANDKESAKDSAAVGEIDIVDGPAFVRHKGGARDLAQKGQAVFEDDLLETGDNGRMRVRLFDRATKEKATEKSKEPTSLMLASKSSMRLSEAKFANDEGKRRVVLNLLSGKLRSRVTNKYEGDNKFQVHAGAAVAGIRGTDFVVAFAPSADEKEWVTEVRTIEGSVKLGSLAKERDGLAGGPESREVTAGMAAAFVSARPKDSSDEELRKISLAGSVTKSFEMSDDDIAILQDSMDVKPLAVHYEPKPDRATAAVSDNANPAHDADDAASEEVCTKPSAQFNQCSYTFEDGNCVRRLCRANGKWEEPRRMPAAQSDYCVDGKPVVRDCGAYW